VTARKITNLKFWGRKMHWTGSSWRIRLPVSDGPILQIRQAKPGVHEWSLIAMGHQPVLITGSPVKARNSAQRYLEKLAADIARESVKR
jgi:hypothetical protein